MSLPIAATDSRFTAYRTCEFLNKLDLTVNFIDLDTFEQSIDHLKDRHHLRELYLMGNPALEWPGATEYVAAQLPQVRH